MVRTKEYTRSDVVDAATRVFWTKGFKGTSVSDLVAATGLNKHSMYQEFGNKEGLFRECVDNFAEKTIKEPNVILSSPPLGLANIEAFFQNRIDYAVSCSCCGCLLVNSMVEKEHIDQGAFGQVQKYLEQLEEAFYQCLKAARSQGQVTKGSNCRVLAKYLLNFTVGMMVMSKGSPTRKELNAIVNTALRTVKLGATD